MKVMELSCSADTPTQGIYTSPAPLLGFCVSFWLLFVLEILVCPPPLHQGRPNALVLLKGHFL